MIGLLALAAASASICSPVPGAERLWANPATQWVMVGEMHGTSDMPVAFGDIVCQATATSHRPVTVAVEQPEEMQPLIDAFMASDGGQAARDAFLQAAMWHGQDGRASAAMFALYERLRQMKQAGRIQAVRAFVPMVHTVTPDGPYNVLMADRLKTFATGSDGLILAYMGNVHAARSSFGQGAGAFLPAAADLPPDRVISVYIRDNGGEAWNCMADGCAPHPMPERHAVRGFTAAEGLPWRYDWVFETGTPSTASPPVVPAK